MIDTIHADGCECGDECKRGLRQSDCVCFIERSGHVETEGCDVCGAMTWHQAGKCLRCGGKQ